MDTIEDWHSSHTAITFSHAFEQIANLDDAALTRLSYSINPQKTRSRTNIAAKRPRVRLQEYRPMFDKLVAKICKLESGVFPLGGTMLAAFILSGVLIM